MVKLTKPNLKFLEKVANGKVKHWFAYSAKRGGYYGFSGGEATARRHADAGYVTMPRRGPSLGLPAKVELTDLGRAALHQGGEDGADADPRVEAAERAINDVWPDMNGVTLRRAARAVLVSLDAYEGESGFVRVPVEPTEAMINAQPASFSPSFKAIWPKVCADIYRAMLSARPAPEASE
jgi:hypothetical protein